MVEPALVVIPAEDLRVKAVSLECRGESLYQFDLFLGALLTAVPERACERFILRRDSKNTYTFLFIFLDKAREIFGVKLTVFGHKVSLDAALVVLHKGGGAPGRCYEHYLFAGPFCSLHRIVNHRYHIFSVAVDREARERFVTFFKVIVHIVSEVGRSDAEAAEVVTKSAFTEKQLHSFLFAGFVKEGIVVGAAFGKGSADANDLLSLDGINVYSVFTDVGNLLARIGRQANQRTAFT